MHALATALFLRKPRAEKEFPTLMAALTPAGARSPL